MSFGKKLLELRKQKGLSQEHLAVDLGVSQSSISNYELGITHPDILILEKVSNYFNVPVSDLFPQEQMIFYAAQNSGGQNSCYIHNYNSYKEDLIKQYRETIELLKEQIQFLKEHNELLKKQIEKIN